MANTAVARLWADRLEAGKIDNFFRVPSKLQPEVRKLLDEDGYMILDDGTVIEKPINDESDEDTNEVVEEPSEESSEPEA